MEVNICTVKRERSAPDGPSEHRDVVERDCRHFVPKIGLKGGVHTGAGGVIAAEDDAWLRADHVGAERVLLFATDAQASAMWAKGFADESAYLLGRARSPEREIGP